VTLDDVLIFAGLKGPPEPTTTADEEGGMEPMPEGTVPFTTMQRAVSANMEATLSVPVFRVSRDISMVNFESLYARLKPKGVTVSALLSKCVARAVRHHPVINSSYDPKGGTTFNPSINIAMAVALNGGLITPVLKSPHLRSPEDLGSDWKDLLTKARSGTLSPSDYNTGTFAISNLGMYGVTTFDAILPPGMGSILAVGGTRDEVVRDPQAGMGIRFDRRCTVTITCDHRNIYGSDAAEFLRTLKGIVESGEI